MPTPPTLSSTDFVIGNSVAGMSAISTWGKTRCAVINGAASALDQFNAGYNSLIIEEGFYPDECHLIRVSEWPYKLQYTIDGTTYYGAAGPYCGYEYYPADTTPDPDVPQKSLISLGGYNVIDPVYFLPTVSFTSLENHLDENDCANFYVGRTINGTYTTDSDFCDSDPTTNPLYKQDLGAVNFNGDTGAASGGFTSISDMTAF